MARPIIGISCMNSANPGGALMAVRPTYLRALEAAGATPLLIHLTDALEVVNQLYQLCAGILLPGGVDLDPALFGESPHPQLGKVDPQRDAVELALARWCRNDGKPLFGICRGLQTINVAFGGSLYQDIPSQLPGSLDHRYNTRLGVYDVAGHSISLSEDSWLVTQLGTSEVLANTMHHQAIKDLAPGLRIVGYAPDGIVEAVEGTSAHFVVAVQCHPEHLWDRAEPRWHKVFQAFVERCR